MRSRDLLLPASSALAALALCACVSGGAAPADAACVDRDGACLEPTCPPPGPYGYELGDTALNLDLRDCDDHPIELHSLCGAKVGMVVNVYTWCAGCFDNAVLASALFEQHAAAGLSTMVVISEDAYEQPATAALCREIRDQYQLKGLVLYDDHAAMEGFGTTDLVMLTDPATVIYFKRRGATEETIVQAVEAGLGDSALASRTGSEQQAGAGRVPTERYLR